MVVYSVICIQMLTLQGFIFVASKILQFKGK